VSTHAWSTACVGSTLACLLALPSLGAAQALDATLRDLTDVEGDVTQLRRSPLKRSQTLSATYVEERLADGELFYRLKDYVRASVIFTDIVDNHAQHRAYGDALFLLGDSLFRAGDYLGARTRLREVIERADEPGLRPFVQRALGRLIEIAVHIRDFGGAEAYFERLSLLPRSEVEAATAYYRAKYLYGVATREADDAHGDVVATRVAQGTLEEARAAFEAIPAQSPYYAQASYFLGVVHALRGQLPQAIEAFRRAVRARVADEEQRVVRDLAQLAVGRLHYEADEIERAIEAYQQVPRTSPNFDAALYEIAWAHIREGDTLRAERALEVLAVAVPDSRFIPDGKLLRGNLLLRDGRFAEADGLFTNIGSEFGPVREQLDRMIADHEDPAAYFRALVRDNLQAFDANAFLPPLAMKWARIEGEMERALAALGDLSTARRLVESSEEIATRLGNALRVDNPVNIFPDLRGHRERGTALRNRLARVRRALAALEEAATLQLGSAKLTATRAKRRQLEAQLGGAPTEEDDLRRRSLRAQRRYRELEKELSALEVALLGMEARIVASERFVADAFKGPESEAIATLRKELEAHRGVIVTYRARMRATANDLETGRLRIGADDKDFARDAQLRREYAEVLASERAILASLGARPDARLEGAFQRVARAEDVLDEHDREVDGVVAQRTAEMRAVLEEETGKLALYRQKLAQLEGDGEVVIGGITFENFHKVQERFYDLVLRADLGGVDVAWAEREEHRTRAEMLTRERARAIQTLDDEFHDMLDGEAPR
jgi:TolA-binding protein